MKKFKLKESGSSVRTELITGLTPSVAKATMGSGYIAMFLSVLPCSSVCSTFWFLTEIELKLLF